VVVLLSLEGSALPAGSLVAQVVTTGPPGRYVLLLAIIIFISTLHTVIVTIFVTPGQQTS